MSKVAILAYADRLEDMRLESFTDRSEMAYFFKPPSYEEKLANLVLASDFAVDGIDPASMSRRESRALRLIATSNIRQASRALLAAEPPPQDVFVEAIQQLIRRDEECAWVADDIRRAIAGQDDGESPSPPSAGEDFEKSIQELVDRALKAAGSTITDLVSAVSWTAVGAKLGGIVGGIVSRTPALEGFVNDADRFVSFVRDKALQLLAKSVEAIQKIVGSDALNKFIENLDEKIGTWGKDKPGGIARYILSHFTDSRAVAAKCAREAGASSEESRRRAVEAAAIVTRRVERDGQWVSHGGKVVGLVGKSLWTSSAAPYIASAVVCFVALTVWQTQDALDTDWPFALPDVRHGIQAAVKEALAS